MDATLKPCTGNSQTRSLRRPMVIKAWVRSSWDLYPRACFMGYCFHSVLLAGQWQRVSQIKGEQEGRRKGRGLPLCSLRTDQKWNGIELMVDVSGPCIQIQITKNKGVEKFFQFFWRKPILSSYQIWTNFQLTFKPIYWAQERDQKLNKILMYI